MRKLVTFGLAGALAIAGLGVTTGSSEADHWDRDGFSFGLTFGSPRYYYYDDDDDYYDDYPRYRTYRTYRTYRYPAHRQVIIRRSGGSSAHVEWCYDRYRSYRVSDNTYQPYDGPRRECISPYL